MKYTRPYVIGAALAALAIAQTPVATVSPTPQLQFFDNNGKPLSGGCLATYAAGTTTPLTSYKDANGTANTNPIILDSSGRANVWLGNGVAYKFTLRQKSSTCSMTTGTVLYTVDGIVDQGSLLRANLASSATGQGGALVGFQQPGGTPTTVGAALALCPDSTQYASLAQAVASVPPSGCLTVSGTHNVTATLHVGNSIRITCQPGALIKPTANFIAIQMGDNTSMSGCAIDGQRAGNTGYNQHCVYVLGSNVTFKGNIVRNCGNHGIMVSGNASDGTNKIGANDEVSGNTVSNIAGCGIFSQDNVDGLKILNNTVDATSSITCSAIAAHSYIDGDTQTNITIKGNILRFSTYWGIEVGNFCQHGLGACVTPSNIVAEGNAGTLVGPIPAVGAGGFISFAGDGVNNGTITGNVFDAGGLNYGIAFIEAAACNHCTITGNAQINANSTATTCCGAVSVNTSNWTTITGNSFQGTAIIYADGSTGISASNNVIANNVFTAPAMMTIGTQNAMIMVECNGPGCNTSNNIVHDNVITGNGGLVQTALGLFNYGTAGNRVDSNSFHDNTLINFTYGLNNNGTSPTNTYLHNNNCVLVATCGPSTLAPKPVGCVTGTGLDAGGMNCLGNLRGPGATVGAETVYSGTLLWTTGAPTTGSNMFTLTMPAGAFAAAPVCQAFPVYFNGLTLMYSNLSASTATSVSFSASTILPAGVQVEIGWNCTPN